MTIRWMFLITALAALLAAVMRWHSASGIFLTSTLPIIVAATFVRSLYSRSRVGAICLSLFACIPFYSCSVGPFFLASVAIYGDEDIPDWINNAAICVYYPIWVCEDFCTSGASDRFEQYLEQWVALADHDR